MGKQYDIYVQKGTPLWKVVTGVLFSHVGLFVLVIAYCVIGIGEENHLSLKKFFHFIGAWVFIELEHGREVEEKIAKEEKTQVNI